MSSEDQRADLLLRTVARWERDGRGTAYDQLFHDPRLFDGRSGKWNRAKRFEIGAEELDRLFAVARRNGIVLDPGASVLALGYDVGFLLACSGEGAPWPLRRRRGGQDRARGLPRARSTLDGIDDCELLALRDFLDAGSSAGSATSSISVMLPAAFTATGDGGTALDRCLGLIEPGGYAYFQLPCHIYDYHYATDAYLAALVEPDRSAKSTRCPSVRPPAIVKHGLVLIEVTPDQRLGPMGFSSHSSPGNRAEVPTTSGGRVGIGTAVHHMRI